MRPCSRSRPATCAPRVDRAVDAHRTLAARKGTELVVHEPDEPVIAEIDSRRIERVLRNLVSNAIEHGEGLPVEVTIGSNDSAVAVTVRDHGVGLQPGEAALVFTRFWRADPARARTTGGTGLGLAIALEDARLHAGRLEAWGALGEGSCFRLTLPRKADATITSSPLPLSPLAAEAAEAPRRGGRGGTGQVGAGDGGRTPAESALARARAAGPRLGASAVRSRQRQRLRRRRHPAPAAHRAGAHAMRRRLLAAAALAVSLVLTACGGLPESGPVIEGRALGEADQRARACRRDRTA